MSNEQPPVVEQRAPASVVETPAPDDGARPRVLHVTEANGAGVETWLRLLADHLPSAHEHAFVLDPANPLAAELRQRGLTVHELDLPRSKTQVAELRAARRLRTLLKRLRPEVLHLHSSQAGLIGRLAAVRLPVRVLYTPHAYYYLGKSGAARRVFLDAERVLARLGGEVVATSPSEADRAVRDVGVRPDRVTTVLNAVELPATAPERRPGGGPFRVGLVARVSPQKNVAMYLRAAARLHRDHPGRFDTQLVGVGHYAQDRAELGRLLGEVGLEEEQVTVVPWMDRAALLSWFDSCDAVVLTSTYESFGYTLAEAAARGVPVLGTDVDGIRDVVRDGVTGHLVPLDDDALLADRLVALADDAPRHAALGRAAADDAAARFDVRAWAGALEHVYACERAAV